MNPPTIRSSHQPLARIACTQSRDVFQSSWTSWSSKIIAVGSVDSSPHARVAPRHAVRVAVLLEVRELLAGRHRRVAPRRIHVRVAGSTSSA